MYPAVAGNQMFTLIVQCGPASTTISENFGALSNVQWLAKNVLAAFQLPTFASSFAGCPLNSQLSSSTTGLLTATAVTNPSLGYVHAVDDTLDQRVDFYV